MDTEPDPDSLKILDPDPDPRHWFFSSQESLHNCSVGMIFVLTFQVLIFEARPLYSETECISGISTDTNIVPIPSRYLLVGPEGPLSSILRLLQ